MRSRSSAAAASVKVMAASSAQPGGAGADQADDAGDEGRGLAGAGARLDEQRGVQVVGGAVAHGLVGEGGGHAGTSEVAG